MISSGRCLCSLWVLPFLLLSWKITVFLRNHHFETAVVTSIIVFQNLSPEIPFFFLRWGRTAHNGVGQSLSSPSSAGPGASWGYSWPSGLPGHTADSRSTCHQPQQPDSFFQGYSSAFLPQNIHDILFTSFHRPILLQSYKVGALQKLTTNVWVSFQINRKAWEYDV